MRLASPSLDEILLVRAWLSAGFSAGSVRSVLRATGGLWLKRRRPLSPDEIVRVALDYEHSIDGSPWIAFQDVAGIVHGGVNLIRTDPAAKPGESPRVAVEPVAVPPEFLAAHLAVGYDPSGATHRAASVLEPLVDHSGAAKYVGRLSDTSNAAAEALRSYDESTRLDGLARGVNAARETFFRGWGKGLKMIHPDARAMARRLRRNAKVGLLAWKPPGAGKASSICVVAQNSQEAVRVMREAGWVASVARVSGGVDLRECPEGCGASITCGMRVDICGGADIGVHPDIGSPGVCLNVAIEPMSWSVHMDARSFRLPRRCR